MRYKNQMTAAQAAKASKQRQVHRLKKLIKDRGLPAPVEEFRFHPARRWKIDLAYPELKVGVEYEGGTWGSGKSRHTTGSGYRNDCEKYNQAAIMGWLLVRVTADMLSDGTAGRQVLEAYRERCQSG